MGHSELSLGARKAALLHALSTYCVPGTATGSGDPDWTQAGTSLRLTRDRQVDKNIPIEYLPRKLSQGREVCV